MRWVVVTLLAGMLALSGDPAAAKDKVPCKKVKEAIAAGKTPDQVAQELGTSVERVDKCMKKKAKAAAPAGGTAGDDEED